METGSHTFVFTDIEGSTKLLQDLGDAYDELLAEHHSIIRDAVATHEGREIENAGDGFFLTFREPRAALEASLDIQRRLRSHERLRVRIGVHAGPARELTEGFVGLAIHHAARVSAAGHGRQVLVTDEARTEVEGASFVDLGPHRLKDLAEPIRIWQLAHPELQTDFPPIRSLGVGGGNLPRPRTSFIGRSDDIAHIGTRLDQPGVLTLTGPGGCGKTRLAIEAARAHAARFLGGTWFVELQSIIDPSDVVPAVARALEVPEGKPDALLGHVVARLDRDPALLLLDNCEHLLESCAGLVDELLERCAELRVIATSRELLGVPGEVAQRISSLAVKGPAVELFYDRARRADPRFSPDGSTETIERICTRLDGIPLAIELAAARVRHLTPDAIEAGLDDRFRVLTGSDRRAMQRHQTLDALVSWSYDLLSEDEAAFLRALSVFAASFTAQHAAAVAGADEAIAYRLVDRSLVEVVEDGRLHLLETVRLFAADRLAASGEAEVVRDRHFEVFAALAERTAVAMRGERLDDVFPEFETSASDVRIALEWALRSNRSEAALRLAASTGWISGETAMGATFGALVEEAVEIPTDDPVAKARMELAAAMHRFTRSDMTSGFAARARASFEAAGATDDPLYAWALLHVGGTRLFAGDVEGHQDLDHALELALERGDLVLEAYVRAMRAMGGAWSGGDLEAGREGLKEARAVAERCGNPYIAAWTSFWSGLASVHAEDWTAAWRHYERALPYFRRLHYKIPMQWTLDHLAVVTLRAGDLASSRAFTEEGIALSRATGLTTGDSNYPNLLATASVFERSLGNHAQAAMYLQEAVDLMDTASQPLEDTGRPHSRAAMQGRLAAARSILGETAEALRLLDTAVETTRGLTTVRSTSGVAQDPPAKPIARAAARVAFESGLHREAAVLLGASGDVDEEEVPAPLRSGLAEGLRSQLGEGFAAAIAEGEAHADPLDLVAQTLARIRELPAG